MAENYFGRISNLPTEQAKYYFVLLRMENQIVKSFKFVLNNIFLKLFRSFDGTSVKSTVFSNHKHWGTSLGIFRNAPIALGCYSPYNIKVESLVAGSWTNLGDYQFAKNIYWYSFAGLRDSLFLIGKILIWPNLVIFWKLKLFRRMARRYSNVIQRKLPK